MKPTRSMIVLCAFVAAVALSPVDAAAQRGGGGGGGAQPRSGGGGGAGGGQRGGGGAQPRGNQAVPRTHPPVVNGGHYRPYYGGYYRPYYGGYYRPYYGGYYPYYGYGGYYGAYGGFGWGIGFGVGLYSGFYAPYYAGYYAQYPYPYPHPYPYYGYSGNWSSARLEIKPRDAQVYVDGYLVGMVDQFDGVFQRLDLPTGEHEIVAYMKGHQPYRQRTLFRPGESYHFKGILEPLPPGTPDEPPPQAANRPDPDNQAPRDPRDPYVRDPYQDPNRQPPPPGDRGRTTPLPDRPGDRRGPESSNFGTLNIRVQPGDAVVVIDGEKWDSPEGGSRLSVQLSGGSHRVEVRKDGFKPYTATIQVRPGETQALNISLPQGQS